MGAGGGGRGVRKACLDSSPHSSPSAAPHIQRFRYLTNFVGYMYTVQGNAVLKHAALIVQVLAYELKQFICIGKALCSEL